MIRRNGSRKAYLAVLIAIQAACAVFFLYDISKDYATSFSGSDQFYLVMEFLATISFLGAILMEGRAFASLQRQKEEAERSLRIASGELLQVIETYFSEWELTATERDVAMFTMKGLSIAEIAEMRGSREGTIKTHLNAIYRKSGTSGRGQLLSLLIEDLMNASLLDGQPSAEAPRPA